MMEVGFCADGSEVDDGGGGGEGGGGGTAELGAK